MSHNFQNGLLCSFSFLVLIASYWSIGDTVNRIFKTSNPKIGQTLSTGLLLFLIQVFCFNVFFELSYFVVSQFIGLQLLALFVFNFSYRIRQSRPLKYKEILIVFAIALFAILIYVGRYQPSHWDEFTYWLLMPKQIFFYDQGLSKNFPYTEFLHYPSGIANASIWFMAVFRQSFQENLIIIYYLTFFFVFMVALLDNLETSETPVMWFSLLVVVLLLFDFIFPKGALIEPIQCCLLGIAVLWIYNLEKDPNLHSFRRNCFEITLILMAAYIVKPSTLVVFVLLLSYLIMVFKKEGPFSRPNLFSILFSLFTFGLLIWSWGYMTSDIPRIGFSKNPTNRFHDWEGIKQWLSLVLNLLREVVLKLHSLKGIAVIFPLLFLLRKQIPPKLLKSGVIFFVFYVILISFTYSFSFAPEEASLLASYDRYMNLPMFVIFLITAIGMVAWFKRQGLKFLNQHSVFAVILIFVSISLIIVKIILHANKKDRDYVEISKTFVKILESKRLDLRSKTSIPKISFLLSDSSCESNHIARYHSIGSKALMYGVGETSVFSNKLTYSCTRPANHQSLISWIPENDYVVIIRENDFLRKELQEAFPHCTYDAPFYLEISKSDAVKSLAERVVCGPI